MITLNTVIQISGHLEEIKGVYHMKITWVSDNGRRQRKSKSTGLPIRGNKKRANDMLIEFIHEQQATLATQGINSNDILFIDYMKQWLEKMKSQIRLTTYSGYHENVYSVIIPYFKSKNLKLRDVKPKDIQDFCTDQLKRVKGSSVKKYHANIHKAFKEARRLQIIESNPYGLCGASKACTLSRTGLYS